MAVLRICKADGTLLREHGLAHRVTTIGRGLGNVIPLPGDRAASLRHASIERTPYGYLVRDEGSRNGTWVNGTRIEERHIHSGDEIRIGRTLIRFSTEQARRTSE